MPTEGQKTVTEYRGFTVTEKYFKQDPYRKQDEKNKKRVRTDEGWSFGIYGVVNRSIIYYTAWSHSVFFKDAIRDARKSATDMIDTLLSGKKIEEVSIVKLPDLPKEE